MASKPQATKAHGQYVAYLGPRLLGRFDLAAHHLLHSRNPPGPLALERGLAMHLRAIHKPGLAHARSLPRGADKVGCSPDLPCSPASPET
jgi:hypothetical protein